MHQRPFVDGACERVVAGRLNCRGICNDVGRKLNAIAKRDDSE